MEVSVGTERFCILIAGVVDKMTRDLHVHTVPCQFPDSDIALPLHEMQPMRGSG